MVGGLVGRPRLSDVSTCAHKLFVFTPEVWALWSGDFVGSGSRRCSCMAVMVFGFVTTCVPSAARLRRSANGSGVHGHQTVRIVPF